jgi:hypothetical protein
MTDGGLQIYKAALESIRDKANSALQQIKEIGRATLNALAVQGLPLDEIFYPTDSLGGRWALPKVQERGI